MAKYISNRQQNLKIGIVSYTENKTVLEVTGKVGIGTTNATEALTVVGVVSATSFYGDGSALTGIVGSGGSVDWIRKTSTYTAINGDKIIADTTSGAFTITLPTSPITGNSVSLADGNDWYTNNLTVARNGSTIEGLADNFILDIQGITADFIYDGTTWEVFANMGPAGAQGTTGTQGLQGIQGAIPPITASTKTNAS